MARPYPNYRSRIRYYYKKNTIISLLMLGYSLLMDEHAKTMGLSFSETDIIPYPAKAEKASSLPLKQICNFNVLLYKNQLTSLIEDLISTY